MAAPIITPSSVTIYSSISPANFSITISAAAAGKILVLCNLSKDDTTTVNLVSALGFDTVGANATLGNGKIVLQGSTQIAQEGIRSSQCGVYFIKNADLPSSAGTYTFEPTFNGGIDRYLWICFELLGNPDEAYDSIVQNSSIIDVNAATKFSDSITPNANDCLIVDIWATSHSTTPSFISTETQVAAIEDQINAGGVVSQFTQVGSPVLKIMEQESSTFMQRNARTLLSFNGVASSSGIPILRRRLIMRKAA